jgi:hypothetical protein
MTNEWQFVIQLTIDRSLIHEIKGLPGVKDAFGEGALLTIIPLDSGVSFAAVHQVLSALIRERHFQRTFHNTLAGLTSPCSKN